MNIILCGGGTAGHITPAISIYDYVKHQGHKPRLVVAQKDYHLIPHSYDFNTININPPGNFFKKILFILKFIPALMKSLKIIKRHKPDCIIGMGGFVSLPMLYVAKWNNIPIFLCEQNSIPGKVNRIFYKYAKQTYLTFSKTLEFMPKGKVFGNPVREDFFVVNREGARTVMKLGNNDKRLVVMGGSQGAKKINTVLVQCLKDLFKKYDIQIIHQTGLKNYDETVKELKKIYPHYTENSQYLIRPYFKKMYLPMLASDIAVSRAGSLSISEICASGLASLLIPYPYASADHQRKNAKEMEEQGAALYLDDTDCTKDAFMEKLEEIINDTQKMIELQNNAKKLVKIDATKNIVEQIKAVVK